MDATSPTSAKGIEPARTAPFRRRGQRHRLEVAARVLCVATVCAIALDFIGFTQATAAPATGLDESPDSVAFQRALAAVGADAAVPSHPDVDSVSVSSAAGVTVDIPVESSSPVVVDGAGSPRIGISPPGAHGLARRGPEGLVIASRGDGALAMKPVPDGVLMMAVIDGPTSPHRLRFSLRIEGGGGPELGADGGVILKDADGGAFGRFDPPWAIDADGSSVPTHYEVDGNDVIQVVDGAGPVAYPVVADPDYRTNCGIATCKRYYTHARSVQLYNEYQGKISAGYGRDAAICALGALGGVPGAVYVVLCAVGWAWLNSQFVDAVFDAAHGDGCAALEYLRASPLGASDPTDWDYVGLDNQYCEKS